MERKNEKSRQREVKKEIQITEETLERVMRACLKSIFMTSQVIETPPEEEPPTPPPRNYPQAPPPKKRDYSFLGNNWENRKCVVATNLLTKEKTYFRSMYAAGKRLGINPGLIIGCCEEKNCAKTGKSKIDGQKYEFAYFREEELPEGCVLLKARGS